MTKTEYSSILIPEPGPRHKNGWRSKVWILHVTLVAGLLFYLFGPSYKGDIRETSSDLSLNPLDPFIPYNPIAGPNKPQGPGVFSLRHIYHHNTEENPDLHARLDIDDKFLKLLSNEVEGDDLYSIWTKKYQFSTSGFSTIRRLADRSPDFVESYLAYALNTPQRLRPKMDFEWVDNTVEIPNVTDKETVANLALIASDAYVNIPGEGDWTNVSAPWNVSKPIGWMSDGVRGHIFANEDNSTVIISIKGTSAAIFDSGGDTVTNDKINDNLLFSCCCARVSYMWNTVCDCYTGSSYTCDQDCLEHELYSQDRYYKAVLDIYRNVTHEFPKSNIWAVGHSLGGSLSALLGRTYGLPAVSFEAPGELLATKRLHLPTPPGLPVWDEHIWQFGNTGDPIFMGVCNGASSSCWVAGYALETQCHSGLQCVYDVVSDLGWHLSVTNHRIHVVIDDVILAYNTTPECVPSPPCKDCFNWKFVSSDDGDDGSHSSKIKSSSTISATSSKSTTSIVSSPSDSPDDTPIEPPKKCIRRSWLGRCLEYGDE